jgi:F-type H+-transporting ATPase subunit delta
MKAEDYAKALFGAITETKPQDHDKVLDNFVKILAQHGDQNLLPQIEEHYHRLEMESKGIKEVQVTTAHKVDQKSLLTDLNKILGKNISTKHLVDEGIIGGVVIRAGDTLIDGSIKNSLQTLKKNLTSNT